MNTATLEAQILSFLQENTDDLDLAESVFTNGIDFLRQHFPNSTINRLMGVVWDVVGQRVAPICFDLKVPVLSFIITGIRQAPQAMIATPSNWVSMVRMDPITQLGGLIYVGSQAVDYANERFDRANVSKRAKAYEAEYLNTVKSLTSGWQPLKYQTEIMQEYPDGVLTPKAHKILYSPQPLILA